MADPAPQGAPARRPSLRIQPTQARSIERARQAAGKRTRPHHRLTEACDTEPSAGLQLMLSCACCAHTHPATLPSTWRLPWSSSTPHMRAVRRLLLRHRRRPSPV